MLGMKTYTKDYIEECRARIDRDLAAYAGLPLPVPEAFEASFFSNMVLLLDYLFVHRLRMVDGKDGNPLNEVRILCNSILNNKGVLTAENVGGTTAFAGLGAIKFPPEKLVLKYQPGDPIRLSQADFALLSNAFFDEMVRRYL